MLDDLRHDIRYSARMLLKNPGLTLIAVSMLAAGIGANTAVFSIVNAVILKPLPVARPHEIVSLYTSDFSGTVFGASSYPDYLDLRDRAEVHNGLIAYTRQSVRMKDLNQAEELVMADIVTGNFFEVLGVRPVAGRAFLDEEDRTPGSHAVALVSHACWQKRLGGDPDVVGKTIELNNHRYSVIGVTPPEFRGLERGRTTDVWLPMMMIDQIILGESTLQSRGSRGFFVLGRLKPGVTLKQSQAHFSALAAQQQKTYPQDWTDLNGQGRRITVLPESDSRIPAGSRDQGLAVAGLVMVLMLLVLGVVCANLAGLLLARAVTRHKEMAVRLALGASRWRLVRQLLSESLLLATIGGLIGGVVAWLAIDLTIDFFPSMAIDFSPDSRVLIFAFAVLVATTITLGLIPAFQATKVDLISALKDEIGLSGYRRSRLRSALVVAQIAFSVLLLSVSGLFLRSLMKAASVDPGFNSNNLLLASVLPADVKEAKGSALYQQALEGLHTIPGVREVSLVNRAGLDFDGTRRNVDIEGYAEQPGEDMEVGFNLIGPYYFRTMETPLLQGRDFNDRDVKGAPGVVIVNETFARRYFPDQEALGKRLSVSGAKGPFLEIVGIAQDAKYWSLLEEGRPFFSLPFFQHYQGFTNFLIRTDDDPRPLAATVRAQLSALDSNSLIDTTTMREHIGFALLPLKIASISSMIFGGLALLLAGLGIYGLIAYLTRQRTREIGVRIALGAQRMDILRLVLGQGITIVVIGIGLGLGAAVATTRLLTSFLFGISATDVLTLVGVSASLAIVALLACWIPAVRASKIDPWISVRCE